MTSLISFHVETTQDGVCMLLCVCMCAPVYMCSCVCAPVCIFMYTCTYTSHRAHKCFHCACVLYVHICTLHACSMFTHVLFSRRAHHGCSVKQSDRQEGLHSCHYVRNGGIQKKHSYFPFGQQWSPRDSFPQGSPAGRRR